MVDSATGKGMPPQPTLMENMQHKFEDFKHEVKAGLSSAFGCNKTVEIELISDNSEKYDHIPVHDPKKDPPLISAGDLNNMSVWDQAYRDGKQASKEKTESVPAAKREAVDVSKLMAQQQEAMDKLKALAPNGYQGTELLEDLVANEQQLELIGKITDSVKMDFADFAPLVSKLVNLKNS